MPLLDERQAALGGGPRIRPPAVGVGGDAVARGAAEEVPDGYAEALTADVPEGLLDRREGGHLDRAAAEEAVAVEGLPVALDLAGVLADEVHGEVLDGAVDGPHAVVDGALADPLEAVLCAHPHDGDVLATGPEHEGPHLGDL